MFFLAIIRMILDYSILTLYSSLFSRVKNDKAIHTISKSSGLVLILVALYTIYKTSHTLYVFYTN